MLVITAWDPPRAYEYTIRKSTFPLEHEGSRLTLREAGSVTEVEWAGAASVPVPILGGLLMRILNRSLEKSFATMLRQVKIELEGDTTSAPGDRSTSAPRTRT